MKIGYMRISRDKQTTLLQEDAMEKEQCNKIFKDVMSGKTFDRPKLIKMIEFAREGDVIVVWRLDRLGRSLKQLIETVTALSDRGIELRSLKENIDTTTPSGKLMFHIIGAMAEFERDIIRERTLAGIEAARSRGRQGGRPPTVGKMDPKKLKLAKDLYDAKNTTVPEIMHLTGFKSKSTFYAYLHSLEKAE